MRVLIGVDGSAASFAAVQLIGRLSAADADVCFYYSPPRVWVRAIADASGSAVALQNILASAIFERARQLLPEPLRRNAATIVGTLEPRQGLLVATDERRADLIVLGARGMGPLRQTTLGNVARFVVHHATVPVLVARGGAGDSAETLQVLLATDGSESSQHAAALLQRFSWPPGTSGQTITVLESPPTGQVPEWLAAQLDDQQLAALGIGYFERNTAEEARLREETARWQSGLPAIFQGREPLVVAGHAGQQILDAINTEQIGLVVVGARRQGPVRRLLLGSTSEHVLTQAPCSVLVVRGHEQP